MKIYTVYMNIEELDTETDDCASAGDGEISLATMYTEERAMELFDRLVAHSNAITTGNVYENPELKPEPLKDQVKA